LLYHLGYTWWYLFLPLGFFLPMLLPHNLKQESTYRLPLK
jgi:glycopeptide antibiotics resistance protein